MNKLLSVGFIKLDTIYVYSDDVVGIEVIYENQVLDVVYINQVILPNCKTEELLTSVLYCYGILINNKL